MFNSRLALSMVPLTIALFVVCSEGLEKYSDKYDYVNVDAILAAPRQRNQYYKCLSGEGPCATPDAKFFRDHLREAIASNCERCTEKQKIFLDKITVYYSENEPEKYRAIVAEAISKARKH